MQRCRNVRMLRFQNLLLKRQGFLEKEFRICVLASFIKIITGVMQKPGRFREREFPGGDKDGAGLDMRETALTPLPRCEFNVWKSATHRTYHPLSPSSLRRLIHLIFEDNLQQVMHGQRFHTRIPTDKRISQQFSDDGIKTERIAGHRLKDRSKLCCPLSQDLFWNSVGVQEGQKAQQFDGRRVDCLELFKRQ